MSKRDFEKLLLESVDEGLSSLGKSSKQAIYFHLEKSFNVKKREIAFSIKDFADGIEKIFGLGANFLEILILKRLYQKIGEAFTDHGMTDIPFSKHVATAKRLFLEKKRRKPDRGLIECEETVMEAK